MGSGEGRRVGPGGGSGGGRAPGVEHRALDAGVGRRGWARGWAPGFGPGAGERVGRPKRRPGQLGGRTVGWAAGRPNGRVKEWKGWQGRTEKDGNGKGPGPSGSRSVKGSFGQPLRSAKGPVKGPVRPSLGPPEFLPERVAPRQVPTRPSLGLSRVRSVPPPVSQRAVPSRSRPVEGSFGHPPPVSLRAVPSRSRLIRGSARQRSGPPEPRPAGVPSRESRTPSRSGPPEPRLAGVPPREGRPTPPRQGPHRTFSPFLPLHVLLLSSTAPAPLTPPTPRPSILRSGAAEPQGPRFDRRGWNRPSQDVERDFGCGAESCRRVGGSVAEASG